MKLKLEEYQQWIVDHLKANDSAALFVGCGLGKTAATLQVINDMLLDGEIRSVLVVAPLRVANLTWKNEVQKWEQFRWMTIANLRNAEGWQHYEDRTAHIYTINYDMLIQLCKRIGKDKTLPFDVVVWDESTKAKNHASKRINAFRKSLRKKFSKHWGLTGTPMPNSMLELFAQYRLLDNGQRLGKAFTNFKNTYFEALDYHQYNWQPKEGSKERIEALVADMTLTLRSSDHLDIPDIYVEEVEVNMPASAKEIYKEFEKELFMLLDGKEVEAANAAVLQNKLMQICGGGIYDVDKNPVHLHKAKIGALRKLHKKGAMPVLVGCNYKFEQQLILDNFANAEKFKDDGDTLERWNRGEIPMLVANPASIGHGLNLQDGGNHLIWYSLPWSNELYDQFTARIARKGQDEITKIFKLICPNTIDDAVVEALRAKDSSQEAVLKALIALRDTK